MKAKLLLVEDNELNLDMLSRRLARSDFLVKSARDGHEALEMTRKESPDLILMDLRLPGIDGWEVTRRLREDPDCCGIPILALTAHALSEDRESALAAGCNDYDTKPIDYPRLLSKIERLLAPPEPD